MVEPQIRACLSSAGITEIGGIQKSASGVFGRAMMQGNSAKKAFVIGSGPNGLTAAIELARAGYRTTIFEAASQIGGGTRSAELTLPGFVHDVCSAVHPLAVSSPAFSSYPLHEHGLDWIEPPIPVSHPLDGGNAAVLYRSIEQTSRELGNEREYKRIAKLFLKRWPQLVEGFLRPLFPPHH